MIRLNCLDGGLNDAVRAKEERRSNLDEFTADSTCQITSTLITSRLKMWLVTGTTLNQWTVARPQDGTV